MRSSNLVN
uniref:Uncharacterized protein n=1 Tax=Arundo donax TaxID=35708 RepID=A0A0A9BWT3_ARUDO